MRLAEFTARPFNLPIEHWSASSLNMLVRCPRQWQARYVWGRKEAPGAAQVLGSALHDTVGFGYQRKIDGKRFNELDAVEFFNDLSWPKELDRFGGAEEIVWDDSAEAQRKLGALMVNVYQRDVAGRVEPAVVEEGFLIDVGLPIPIKGFIDVVQVEGRPIIDLKSSKTKRTQLKPEWRLQGSIYQLHRPGSVDWHVVTKAKTPTTWTGLDETGLMQGPESRSKTLAEIRALNDMAVFYMATFGPDADWPQLGRLHDWACNWCAYKPDCPAWAT